jgi:hypothetical protein
MGRIKGPTKAERWGIQVGKACERYGVTPGAYRKLCSLSERLRRWGEEEANGTIQRAEGDPLRPSPFDGGPHRWLQFKPGYWRDLGPIPDGEALALSQARRLVAEVPGLGLYHQPDPRGTALYLYRLEELPEGGQIDCLYSSIGHPCYRET